jgi:CheY-like chemotaxis protein
LFVEPFFTNKARRQGFGLAVAYGLLSAHRGGLSVANAPHGGALARVLFPVAQKPAASSVIPESAPAAADVHNDEKVLVVDDDPMILQFVSMTLEQAGYRVMAVTNADEALDCYASSTGSDQFRLVLSDVVMPRVTGVDLARNLLNHDANARILFMSGQVSPDFPRKDFAEYQFDLLSKPFRPEGLLRAVRGALDRESSPRSSLPKKTAGIAGCA